MTILHVIDFLALSALIVILCDVLRVLDGRKHPMVAAMWTAIAITAFWCATYDINGEPLSVASVVVDCFSTGIVWKWLRK